MLTWTIAYRKRKANNFRRVTNWSGTWDEAADMANRFGEINPDLEIWYVPTRSAELAGRVHLEDIGNILTNAGRRVHITDTGTLPDSLLTNYQPSLITESHPDHDKIHEYYFGK